MSRAPAWFGLSKTSNNKGLLYGVLLRARKFGVCSLTEHDDLPLCLFSHGVPVVSQREREARDGDRRVRLTDLQLQVRRDVPAGQGRS
jgi:hypothetical protein